MSEIAIRAEKLGKRYELGERQPYNTFREAVLAAAATPFRRMRRMSRPAQVRKDVEFIALHEISFEIGRGEVVGIIGNNGAGKSTLLKILSRITEPTSGWAEIHGRVSSLLEVGTGFHSELTGRENVYVNGAILGMTKAEIDRKFDAIVDFAEVERFLDTPVKRYSSGMRVRLAFAVAAHIEPEILIVDEVLAVGDAAFQAKCLGKMSDVASLGRTVLFVSHNMGAMIELTDRCLLLEAGRLALDGDVEHVVATYLNSRQTGFYAELSDRRRPPFIKKGDRFRFTSAELLVQEGRMLAHRPLEFRLKCHGRKPVTKVEIGASICHPNGTRLITCHSSDSHFFIDAAAGKETEIAFRIEHPCLAPGHYLLELSALSGGGRPLDALVDALSFEISPNLQDVLALKGLGQQQSLGLRLPASWGHAGSELMPHLAQPRVA